MAPLNLTDNLKTIGIWVGAVVFVVSATIGVTTYLDNRATDRFALKTEVVHLEGRVQEMQNRGDRVEASMDRIEMQQRTIIQGLAEVKGQLSQRRTR